MRVFKTNYGNNPNIGLYTYCTDNYCLLGMHLSKKNEDKISETLGVPVYHFTVARSMLIGVLLSGNRNCLLVPEIVNDEELEILDELGIKYKVIETKFTALGNNMSVNDQGAIINPEFEEKAEQVIKEALNVPVKRARIGGFNIPGSCCVSNKKVAIVHDNISEKESEIVESLLKAKVLPITINGSPYVKSGIVLNNKGYLISNNVKSIEIVVIDQTLNE